MTNYFSLLSIPESFDLDLAALEKEYFDQQRKYHPDKFVGKPVEERQVAAARSADINQAYETLKNPLRRAQYLLKRQGITVGSEQDSIKPSQETLMEAMELREAPPAPEILGAMIESSIATIADCYTKADWNAMAQETLRLGYLLKAQENL